MIAILDANILIADFFLRGIQFQTLLDNIDRLEIELFLPEVAFKEVVNKYREELLKLTTKIQNHIRALDRLRHSSNESMIVRSIIVEVETTAYEKLLRKELAEHRINLLPIPNTSLEEIIQRDLHRKKPFGKSSGYRDYLIWKNVIQKAWLTEEKVVFVSSNSRDFNEGDDFHSDLLDEMEEKHITSDQLTICGDLRTFNDMHVLPHLRTIDDLNGELKAKGISTFDLYEWMRENFGDILLEEYLLEYGAGLEYGVGSAHSAELLEPPFIDIKNIHESKPGSYIIHFIVRLNVQFILDLDWEDYEASDSVRDLLGNDEEPWDWTVLNWHNTFEFELQIILAGEPPKVMEIDQLDIDVFYG